MKKLFLLCMCSLGLYGTLFPQTPTGSSIASPTAAAASSVAGSTSTPTAVSSVTSSSVSSDLADRIHRKLEKKLGHKHGIIIDGADKDGDEVGASNDIPTMVIPLVAIVFLTIFGAPVLIVMLIGAVALIGS